MRTDKLLQEVCAVWLRLGGGAEEQRLEVVLVGRGQVDLKAVRRLPDEELARGLREVPGGELHEELNGFAALIAQNNVKMEMLSSRRIVRRGGSPGCHPTG